MTKAIEHKLLSKFKIAIQEPEVIDQAPEQPETKMLTYDELMSAVESNIIDRLEKLLDKAAVEVDVPEPPPVEQKSNTLMDQVESGLKTRFMSTIDIPVPNDRMMKIVEGNL